VDPAIERRLAGWSELCAATIKTRIRVLSRDGRATGRLSKEGRGVLCWGVVRLSRGTWDGLVNSWGGRRCSFFARRLAGGFMTRKIGDGRRRGMPVCRGCEHGGSEHNWVSAACSNCGGRSPHCPFCFRRYEQGRKRGQCLVVGCACGKYVPVALHARPLRPANTYAARLLQRKRA